MSDVMIGNIELNISLRLKGLTTAPDLSFYTMTSTNGTTVTKTLPPADKRPLTLLAVRNGNKIEGYYTKEQVDAIKDIARNRTSTTLKHHRGLFTVLILSTADLVPVQDVRDPQAETKYVGPIHLQEV